MKKYWTLAKLSFQQQLIYRGDVLMYRLSEFASTILFVFVWIVFYGARETIEGYTLIEMITYVAGVGIIDAFTRTWVADSIERDVHKGRLSTLLLKPLNYLRYRFVFDLSLKQLSTWFSVFTHFLVVFLLRRYFIIGTDFLRWFLFLVSIANIVLMRFLLFFAVGLLSFWFIRIGGAINSFRTFFRIMSGSVLPLELFPQTLESVTRLLPFAYMQYFSMQIYLGRISTFEILKGLGVQLFWITVLAIFAKLFWRKALKRYESVGM